MWRFHDTIATEVPRRSTCHPLLDLHLLAKGLPLDITDLRRLLISGETEHVEFKVAPPRVSDLATRVCGFANGGGGHIVLGVADGTWTVVGVADSAAASDTLLRACRQCKPAVPLDPSEPQVLQVDGKTLVVAHIPPNDGTLYQASGAFYIRRGTHTVPLEAREIEAYFHARGTLAWEARPVPLATLDDLDRERVRAYLAQRPGRRAGAPPEPDRVTLERIGCAVPDSRNPAIARPTHAGLLLFGHAPHEFILHAEVVCVLFGDALGLRRYLDRRILHGTLAQQIDGAEEFFTRTIRVGARTEGFRRIDEPDLPLEALREAIVNAVLHRDYSLTGEAVRLFSYPDRVEVHSPGVLVPGLRLADLRQGQAPSRPRNPLLATLLRDAPGGYMERLGSGISFMIREMRALGRPDPEFREQNEFVVTFRLAPTPTEAPAPLGGGDEARSGATEVPALVPAAQRREVALRYVQDHGAITNKIYRGLTGVSDMTALRDLETLVSQGSLQPMGQGRGRRYTL